MMDIKTTGNPYYLAGPFAAASAVLAMTSNKLAGMAENREHLAALISQLMSAGASAEAAYAVSETTKGLNPTTTDNTLSFMSKFEDVRRRTHSILEGELDQNQLTAFDLGFYFTQAHNACTVQWKLQNERKRFIVDCLVKVSDYAVTLNLELNEISVAIQTAQQSSTENDFADVASFLMVISGKALEFLYKS